MSSVLIPSSVLDQKSPKMEIGNKIAFKVAFKSSHNDQNQLRKILVSKNQDGDVSLDHFRHKILRDCFPNCHGQNVCIQYDDQDGDRITIGNEEEFQLLSLEDKVNYI